MIEFYMLLKSNDYEVSIKSFRIEFYTKPLIFKTIGIKNYVEILSKNNFNQNTYITNENTYLAEIRRRSYFT
jgi:hypothetical protein